MAATVSFALRKILVGSVIGPAELSCVQPPDETGNRLNSEAVSAYREGRYTEGIGPAEEALELGVTISN